MEALILVLVVVAVALVVLWLLRRLQGRRPDGTTAPRDDVEPTVMVVVDLPAAQRASFIAALALHVDDSIRLGSGAHRSMVSPPSTVDHVILDARDGDRTLDAVLAELYDRGFRIDSTSAHAIGLSDPAGAEATVMVRAAEPDKP